MLCLERKKIMSSPHLPASFCSFALYADTNGAAQRADSFTRSVSGAIIPTASQVFWFLSFEGGVSSSDLIPSKHFFRCLAP